MFVCLRDTASTRLSSDPLYIRITRLRTRHFSSPFSHTFSQALGLLSSLCRFVQTLLSVLTTLSLDSLPFIAFLLKITIPNMRPNQGLTPGNTLMAHHFHSHFFPITLLPSINNMHFIIHLFHTRT